MKKILFVALAISTVAVITDKIYASESSGEMSWCKSNEKETKGHAGTGGISFICDGTGSTRCCVKK